MGEEEDVLELGGNIVLSGFSGLDAANMIVLKKIVGNYARKFSDRSETFEKLHLTMKAVHKKEEQPKKFELHAKLIDNGKVTTSELTERNLFVGIDSALKKIEHEIK